MAAILGLESLRQTNVRCRLLVLRFEQQKPSNKSCRKQQTNKNKKQKHKTIVLPTNNFTTPHTLRKIETAERASVMKKRTAVPPLVHLLHALHMHAHLPQSVHSCVHHCCLVNRSTRLYSNAMHHLDTPVQVCCSFITALESLVRPFEHGQTTPTPTHEHTQDTRRRTHQLNNNKPTHHTTALTLIDTDREDDERHRAANDDYHTR